MFCFMIERGPFSVVMKGKELATGNEYAIKCRKKSLVKEHLLKRQVEIMKKVLECHLVKT